MMIRHSKQSDPIRTTTTKVTLVACLAVAGLSACSTANNAPSSPTTAPGVSSAPDPSSASVDVSPPTSDIAVPPTAKPATSSCDSANLVAAVTPDAGGGAAGSTYVNLVFTNTGTNSCTLQGWPGVSFVGGGNGTQMGRAADRDGTSPDPTVTVAPNGTATSTVRIVRAGDYSTADCKPIAAEGFRVYPPDQTVSLFAAYSGLTACASEGISLLTVSGIE